MNLQRGSDTFTTGLLTIVLLIGSACTSRPAGKWQSPLGRDHPLAGQIWDVTKSSFIDTRTLVDRLAQRRLVLLGEKHDNPDHHQLQASLLSALTDAGRRPAVGFEMFDTDYQPAIDQHLAAEPTDAAGLADVVNWERTGWPDWTLYQPIVEVALEAGLPILATNLPRETTRGLRDQGLAGVEAALVATLGLDRPIPPEIKEAMAAEIRESHCGYASEAMVTSMITVQRARDAQMAERLAAGQADGAVLITGLEHARTDWGIPNYVTSRLPGITVVSLAFLEVERDHADLAAYATHFGRETLPFDYVWFTPRVDDVDPCEKFEKQLKKLKKKHSGRGQP